MSNVGFRVNTMIDRPSKDLVEAFRGVPVANLSDSMSRGSCLDAKIRPMNKYPLLGTAITVKPRIGDNLMLHKAIDLAQPGDVIIVDCQGDTATGVIGELMTSWAVKRGIAGVVVDGAIRDIDAIQNMKISVYAAGIIPQGPCKEGPGEINVPVFCGGVEVNPGDIIVGDADGIVVVKPKDAAKILEKAKALNAKEEDALKQINALTWDRSWVDKKLKEKGCEIL
ncbi:MAG: RraA family protein [Negativicutes bacterium]